MTESFCVFSSNVTSTDRLHGASVEFSRVKYPNGKLLNGRRFETIY